MQRALDVRLKELVEQLGPRQCIGLRHTRALRSALQLRIRHRERVAAEHGVERRHPLDARKGRRERGHRRGVRGMRAHRVRGRDEQLLYQEHHVRVVRVRLVPLEHRKLGVVRAIDALVPKVVADLVHGVEAADDQPLEIELIRYAQEERHVERVVVRRERARRCAAVERLQHRRLDLEKAFGIEKGSERADHFRSRDERRAHIGVHREIHGALAIALLRIAESRVAHYHTIDGLLLSERERAQRLREHLGARDAYRRLARLRAEQRTRDADHVADVEELERLGELLAQIVLTEVELDAPRVVGEMREARLPLPAPRDDPPRDAHDLALVRLPKRGDGGRRRVRAHEAIRVRRDPARDQRVVLLAARLENEVLLFGGHAAFAPGAPARLRYASMNGSIAPSITLPTSVILSSVR